MSIRHKVRLNLMCRLLAVLAICGVSPPLSHAVALNALGPSRPAQVDDVLKIQLFGSAKFSPDGRWLAYSVTDHYDQLSDYSHSIVAPGRAGLQVFLVNLDDPSTRRKELETERSSTYYIIEFSPNSEILLLLESSWGRIYITACSVVSGQCQRMPQMPDFQDRYFSFSEWNENPIWTSDETVVFPTRGHSLPGSEQRSRAEVGEFLYARWHQAWRGRASTATQVVSTHRERTDDWAPGALTEWNVRTGETRTLFGSRFAAATLSPAGDVIIGARVGERIRPPTARHLARHETHPFFDRRYAPIFIEAATGLARPIPAPFNVDPGSFAWADNGQQVAAFGWGQLEGPQDGRFYVFDRSTLESIEMPTPGLEIARVSGLTGYRDASGPVRPAVLQTGLVVYGRQSTGDRFDWFHLSWEGQLSNLTASLDPPPGRLVQSSEQDVFFLADGDLYRVTLGQPPERLAGVAGGTLRDRPVNFAPGHAWALQYRFNPEHLPSPFRRDPILIASNTHRSAEPQILLAPSGSIGPSWEQLDVPFPHSHVITASAHARAALVSVKRESATELHLVRLQSDAPERLAVINEHLNGIAHPRERQISFQLRSPSASDDLEAIEACVLVPHDYQADQVYPILMDLYPTQNPLTCTDLSRSATPGFNVRDLWTSRGFIYFRPILPQRWVGSAEGPVSGVENIVEQTIHALSEAGIGDPERVVVFGFSQGSAVALHVASTLTNINAVIAVNGWADYYTHYFGPRGLMRYFHLDQNGGDNRWRYECDRLVDEPYCPFGFGVSAMDAPELYVRASPMSQARAISAPVLLVHSDLDYFDMTEFDSMFAALFRAGKEASYVRYWGEGHGPSSPANIRDYWSRIDQFLEEQGVLFNPAE